MHDQPLPTTFRSVAEAALTEYLRHRGYLGKRAPLRITPAPTGSGYTKTSTEHDRVLADR